MKSLIITLSLVFCINFSYAQQLNKIDIKKSQESFIELKNELKNKEIIGVGEATHGTSEFFTFKSELFKFLVKELNYKSFGMEAQAGAAMRINDFINGGNGDLNALIKELNFWAWETEEVKNLILWMQDYNSKHSEKIYFYGFDMQLTHNAVFQLYSFFEKADKQKLTEVKNAYKNYGNPAYNFKYYKLSSQIKIENLNRIKEIHEFIKNNKPVLVDKTSNEEWKNALYLSHVLLESENIFRYHYSERDKLRDKSMANLIQAYQTIFDNHKTMIWAHNGHITKTKKYKKKTLGMYLNDSLGNKYFSLGLLFNSGSFRAQKGSKVRVFTLKAAPKESILNEFSSYGSSFYMNLDSQPELMKKKLNSLQYVYDVPANFKKSKKFTLKKFILAENYDAIVFFDKTNAAVPINDQDLQ